MFSLPNPCWNLIPVVVVLKMRPLGKWQSSKGKPRNALVLEAATLDPVTWSSLHHMKMYCFPLEDTAVWHHLGSKDKSLPDTRLSKRPYLKSSQHQHPDKYFSTLSKLPWFLYFVTSLNSHWDAFSLECASNLPKCDVDRGEKYSPNQNFPITVNLRGTSTD